MKLTLIGFLFLGLIISGQAGANYHDYKSQMKVDLSPQYALGNGAMGYQLKCEGAKGSVSYSAEGLPQGAYLSNDRIIIGVNTKSGNYNIKITAIDTVTGLITTTNIALTVTRIQGASGSSGAGSTAGIATDARLTNAINNFSTVSQYTPTDYEGNRYPTTNFPSGVNPDSFNPTPSQIGSEQAPRSNTNRNTITADDVALKAASERYQNAVKGITNLLTIIDQTRANKAKAQSDLAAYTQDYNDAINKQRDAQNAIINAELKVKQI